ncbi:MAG: hypothetical protein AB7S26_25105 [Sandaracinaceae bacterium]
MNGARRAAGLALALAVLGALASVAEAQNDLPVQIEVESVFGPEVFLAEGWSTVLVSLENHSRTDMRGELSLEVSDYASPTMRRTAPLDLPGGERRHMLLPAFVAGGAQTVSAVYTVEGTVRGRGSASPQYSGGALSVVVFQDPPRLRGALLDLDVFEQSEYGPRQMRAPVGAVRFDPASSDPILPESALGYSTVFLLVAHAPALSRASAIQRRALEDWLRAGGRLIVFPRSSDDVADPYLVSLVGRATPMGRTEPPGALVAPETPGYALECDASQVRETFGCSRAYGLGHVYVASYDGTTPSAIESGAPRELVRSIWATPASVRSALPLGRGENAISLFGIEPGNLPHALREVLDPNEGFRPALFLVAIVLLVYVILVGPVNFSYVQRRGRPTLALLTTPAAAIVCVLTLLAVGYVGKGARMRYRRLDLIELHEGETRGAGRRITAYFSTRPGAFDLDPSAHDGGLVTRLGGSAAQGPLYQHETDGVHLRDFRSGLWETIFMRDERFVQLDGPVTFTRSDGGDLREVVNRTGRRLQHAFIVDTTGAVFVIGDVAPSGTGAIPATTTTTVTRGSPAGSWLGRALGLGEEERELANGMTALMSDSFVPHEAPVLYAILDPESSRLGDRFAPERDARWIRVTPIVASQAVLRSDPPQTDPYANYAEEEDEADEGDADVEGDAGTSEANPVDEGAVDDALGAREPAEEDAP